MELEVGQIFKVLDYLVIVFISFLFQVLLLRCWFGLKVEFYYRGLYRFQDGTVFFQFQVTDIMVFFVIYLYFLLNFMVIRLGSRFFYMFLVIGQNGEGFWVWREMYDCFGYEILCQFFCLFYIDIMIVLLYGLGYKVEGWKRLMEEGVF